MVGDAKTMNWHEYFLKMARFVATKSKDKSTKCGCVIVGEDNQVLSTGYNGFTRGTEYDDTTKEEKPEKYYWFEHSERNAIYNAASHGIALKNATAYITAPPCHDCARGLVQSGIKRVIIPVKHDFLKKESRSWDESVKRSKIIMENAKVELLEIEIDVD